jgi:hypothetical protein
MEKWNNEMRRALPAAILFLSAVSSFAQTQPLAVVLSEEGRAESAAVEFRRQAMDAESDQDRGHYYWAAAYEYWKTNQTEAAEKMLDRSEDSVGGIFPPAPLLRGEIALAEKKYDESAYHWEGLIQSDASADYKNYAARRLAVVKLRQQQPDGAQVALSSAPDSSATAMEALEKYRQGKDKSPTLGGLLGIIPGLGYFYSGEYANGARSIILNALFIWGMVSTAESEEWGFFSVITFGEITWYSGSIYGGVDSAARYNRRRLEECERGMMGQASFEPDWKELPLLQLRFKF